ncbi:maestro heat-like repeat-containing protein family member 2B [Tympanuchus pallidicinctus]|uniref:maestro heat-like repeat-containing protein family member 2B n=1 Tax=Tympanuchus pallidicinctus TaxID=109042 RepID=UPI00228737A5|nr:maestro heat-like repeat-containing protein family member 2B [Tympanuchus pallidicinctus]
MFFSLGPQDLQNNLALVQSITSFSSALQAVDDSACFNSSFKGKLLEILMDLLKKYYSGIPVSPVPLKLVLALEQLSKLKPSLESKDTREILVLCCKNIVMHPSAEMMLKIRKSQQAAQYLQLQQTSLKSLGQLMAVLLKTEPTRGFFQNTVHVLQRSMTSDNVWERKRALQTCSQLLTVCEEFQMSKEPHHVPSAPSPVPLSWKASSTQLCMLCHSVGKAQAGEAGATYSFVPASHPCREEMPRSTLAPWWDCWHL